MKVGVVLVHWNSGDCTRACLESLLQAEKVPWRILVWDNASTDGAIEQLKKMYPEVWIVKHNANIGFADACNRGSNMLMEKGADAIWLLNNDTVVDSYCLSELVEYLEKRPDICMTTAKIFYADKPQRIWYAGGYIKPVSLKIWFRFLNQMDVADDDKSMLVSFASGCCMLIRASAIKQFGMFTPAFIAYAEDYELCLKLKFAQQKILYIPSAMLWHKVSASCRQNEKDKLRGTVSPMQHYLGTRNRVWALRNAVPHPLRRSVAIFLYVLECLYLSAGLIVFSRWKKLLMLWKGLCDGMMGDSSKPYNPHE